MDSLSKVFTIILAVALCLMFPLYDHLYKADLISYNYVYNETVSFVDHVRDQGQLTPDMYNTFVEKIHLTGRFYKVELEHYAKRVAPEYTDPSDINSFTGDISTHFEGYYTSDILDVLFVNNESIPVDDSRRTYQMRMGDQFSVIVTSESRSAAEIMRDAFTGTTANGNSIYIPYGGMVRNES